MEAAYQNLKAALLAAGSRGALSIAAMDAQLRAASAIHRGLQQLRKGITRTPPPLTPQKPPRT
jgi:phosphate:Na+ symporter